MKALISNYKPRQLLFGAAASIFIAMVTPYLMSLITALGYRIPQEDIIKDYMIGVIWSITLGASILFWPVAAVNKRLLLWGWLAKMAVTLGFMLLYESHYGLDAFGYFEDAKRGWASWEGFDSESVNNIMRNIPYLHQVIGLDSYHAIKVTFSMLGLIGIYLYYRASVTFLKRESPKVFILFALFPSILFWSSILGKDPIVFLGIAIYVYGVIGFYRLRRLKYLVITAAGVATAILIRQWLGPIMILPLLTLFLRGKGSIGLKTAVLVFVGIAIWITAGTFMERFKVEAFNDIMTAADTITKGYVSTPGGSTQNFNVDLSSGGSLIKFLPLGAFTALFRPLPGEVMNPFGLLAGLESFLLCVLLWLSIKRTRLRELKEPLVMWAILFTMAWALVHGLVSSANLGVAVRYRLQILPVLLGVLFYLSRKREVMELKKI